MPSRKVCHLRGCKKLLIYSNPSLVVPMGNKCSLNFIRIHLASDFDVRFFSGFVGLIS